MTREPERIYDHFFNGRRFTCVVDCFLVLISFLLREYWQNIGGRISLAREVRGVQKCNKLVVVCECVDPTYVVRTQLVNGKCGYISLFRLSSIAQPMPMGFALRTAISFRGRRPSEMRPMGVNCKTSCHRHLISMNLFKTGEKMLS